MASLYEIRNEILECERIDAEAGEIIDEERLTSLTMNFNEKVENIACWEKNLLSLARAIKEEIDNLMARKRALEAKAESLKRCLFNALEGQKFETSKVKISYRKADAVDVWALEYVPQEYLKYAEPTVDKMAVKKALKGGKDVPGCKLVTAQHMQIK